MKTLQKLQSYMGKRKILLPISMLLSALSSLLGLLPYLLIWLVVKQMLVSEGATSQSSYLWYAWWAAGLAMLGVIVYFLALMSSHLAAFRVESNLRKEAMKKVVGMPLGFFDCYTTGKIRKIIDDNASITHTFLAHQLPDLASTLLTPLVLIVFIFVFDWRLGLAAMVPLLFALIIIGYLMGSRSQKFMTSYMNALETMNSEAVEYVRGIPVVKVFQQTLYSFKNFYNSIMHYNSMVKAYTRACEKPMTLYIVLINSFVFFLVPLAILLVGYSGESNLVLLNFFLFVLVTPIFSQSIMRSMHLSQAIGQATEAIDRLEHLYDFKEMTFKAVNPPIKAHDIAFSDVSFTYPSKQDKAIDRVTFAIGAKQHVALVGPSGGGKSTIARLIPRFWDADSGEITIGGVSIREISKRELMNNISFVFQNTKLFKTTLFENIAYGVDHASRKSVEAVVDMAQCRDIIDRLPQGLETKIGAEGTYLSGGEQQRIVLARAILKDAPIIVLDEATAFTDPENEHLIHQALKELTKGKTVLTIAHRLSNVVDADKILVVDNGTIVQQGTHSELLNQEGLYLNMWNEYQRSVRWSIKKEETYA